MKVLLRKLCLALVLVSWILPFYAPSAVADASAYGLTSGKILICSADGMALVDLATGEKTPVNDPLGHATKCPSCFLSFHKDSKAIAVSSAVIASENMSTEVHYSAYTAPIIARELTSEGTPRAPPYFS